MRRALTAMLRSVPSAVAVKQKSKTVITPQGRIVRFVRRTPDGSIDWRFWSQTFWTVITIWIGYEFVRFVHFHQSGMPGAAPTRSPGVESFLPISGLMGLRDWIVNGVLNNIHPAATIVVGLAILSSLLFKKSFCGWVCPVGFTSESIASVGQKVHRWKGKLPRALDWPFRAVKYLLLTFFVWAIFWTMSPADLRAFIISPYNRVADVKMLLFFTEMSTTTFWVLVGLVAASFLVSGFWCRFLCPYGALTGLVSLMAPWKITRTVSSCIDCDKCTAACPQHIPVANLARVRSDECNACLECVNVCPAAQTLQLALPRSRFKINRRQMLIAVTALFVIGIGIAQLTGHWQNSISQDEYRHRISEIDSPKYQHNQGNAPADEP